MGGAIRQMATTLALGGLLVGGWWTYNRVFRTIVCRNDTAAIATLRNLHGCQEQFRSRGVVDVDGDGRGEYGTFAELTGTIGVRGSSDGAQRGDRVSPAILSPSLAAVGPDGVVTKAGYCFRIFLPGRYGTGVREGRADAARLSGDVETDTAEGAWCAYAWPVAHGNSGVLAFFVDQRGDVLQTANLEGTWSGREGGPPVSSAWARGPAGGWAGAVAVGTRGRDGELWTVTN